MTRRFPLLATLLLIPSVGLSSGCDFLDQLQQRTGIVDVFAASHGTPDEQGNLPTHNGEQLIFVNDMGWEVFIDEGYVTTSAVILEACDGQRFNVELYWGPLAEDIGATADRESNGLGGVRADSGTYCQMMVEYAPTADTVENPDAIGSTVYLTGSALKGGKHIDFLWKTDMTIEVPVDISNIEAGGPFRVSENQNFAKDLTITKSYDQFFAGVDFNDKLTQGDVEALISATLMEGTIAKVDDAPY